MPKFCPTCGKPLQFENAEICPSCGVRIIASPQPLEGKYAGFWIRFAAYIIDLVILTVIAVGIGFVLGIFLGIFLYADSYRNTSYGAISGFVILFYLIFILIIWLYFAIQESSTSQATIGKRVVNIKVTDNEGNRIGFGKATLRTLIKFIPIIGSIGCLVIGFSDNKQGLHDILASTYVKMYKD